MWFLFLAAASGPRYASSFTETLFLHKGINEKVNLRNLFVPHRFSTVSRYRDSDRYSSTSTLDEYLARFIRRKDRQPPLLLIEGGRGLRQDQPDFVSGLAL